MDFRIYRIGVIGLVILGILSGILRYEPAPEKDVLGVVNAGESTVVSPGQLPPGGEAVAVGDLPPEDDEGGEDLMGHALENGVLLEEEEILDAGGRLVRTRILLTMLMDRPFRVEEIWERNAGGPELVHREVFLADQVLVEVGEGVSEDVLRGALQDLELRDIRWVTDRIFTVRLAEHSLDALRRAMEDLRARNEVISVVEKDGIGTGGGIPNDPSFWLQWALRNTAQFVGAVANTDIKAPAYWDVQASTPGMVVAVLDSGMNFDHPDLSGIAWTNPGEVAGDFVDNDANGFLNDIRGWDFVGNDNNPSDEHNHGTHVAGILGARRNNGVGVAGLLDGVNLMICRILNANNAGTSSQLIAALAYARNKGVRVMNLSVQGYSVNSLLEAEVGRCDSAGILMVICAGNQGANTDTSPNLPSSYGFSNIISVAGHDMNDVRYATSNYGASSVDLFAPGRSVLSTLRTDYGYYTGTSQAAPHVTALAAAILHANPGWTGAQVKAMLLSTVTTAPAYTGLCVSGGRLNAERAIIESTGFLHPPVITPAGGDYFDPVTVSLSTASAGASIRYTTDGTDPTATHGTVYSGPFVVSATSQVRVVAFRTGYTTTSVVASNYGIHPSAGGLNILAGGSFESPIVSGSLANPTGGPWVFNASSGIQANGSAWGAAAAPNGIQTAYLRGSSAGLGRISQNLTTTAGTFSLSFQAARRSGQIQPLRILLDGAQVGSTIIPVGDSFEEYTTDPFSVAAGTHSVVLETTDATGDLTTFVDSIHVNVLSLRVSPPEFSLSGGIFNEIQYVSMSCPTEGATIRYTLDGSDPTAENGFQYLGVPLVVDTDTVLRAAAFLNGWEGSEAVQANYTVNLPVWSTWLDEVFPAGTPALDMLPLADPNGDGITNLMAYALGVSPLGDVDSGHLPAVVPLEENGSAFLAYRFRRNTGAGDVIYHLESSSSLAGSGWSAVSVEPQVLDPNPDGDGGAELVEVRVPLDSGSTHLFLRLRVSLSP